MDREEIRNSDRLTQQLMQVLSRAPGGLSVYQLSRRVGNTPSHKLQTVLLRLQKEGRADFRANRWHGVGPAGKPWLPSDRLGSVAALRARQCSLGRGHPLRLRMR